MRKHNTMTDGKVQIKMVMMTMTMTSSTPLLLQGCWLDHLPRAGNCIDGEGGREGGGERERMGA
jgi:hypothetical protein